MKKYRHQALEIKTDEQFTKQALITFQFQYKNIAVYKEFVDFLKINPNKITSINQIPFLPISLFKTHQIISRNKESEITFKSSGTTGMERSEHHLHDLEVYRNSFRKGFDYF